MVNGPIATPDGNRPPGPDEGFRPLAKLSEDVGQIVGRVPARGVYRHGAPERRLGLFPIAPHDMGIAQSDQGAQAIRPALQSGRVGPDGRRPLLCLFETQHGPQVGFLVVVRRESARRQHHESPVASALPGEQKP